MAIDFAQYQPPGVYIEDATGHLPVSAFTRNVTLGLVGWAKGVRSASEQVQMVGTTASSLTNTTALTGAVVVSRDTGETLVVARDYTEAITQGALEITRVVTGVLDEAVMLNGTTAVRLANPHYVSEGEASPVVRSEVQGGGTLYVEGVDYSIDYDNGTIVRIAGNGIADGGTAYVSYSYAAIRDGAQVTVTYQYTNESYYDVTRHDSFESVRSMYGDPFSSAGTIDSQLSLGAYFAFLNGAQSIYCVAVENDDASANVDFVSAMDKLKSVEDVDIITPLSGDNVVMANAASHVTEMFVNRAERRVILGADGSAAPISSTSLKGVAKSLNNERVMLVSPSSVQYYNTITNAVEVMPAYYLAAALAGVAASLPPYQSLTYQRVNGFYALNERRTRTQKMEEARNGLCVLEESSGSLRVFHGITTNSGSILSREYSIVFSRDRMAQLLRDTFATSVIGQPIVENTVYVIKGMTAGVLDIAQRSGYIYSYSGIDVQQSAVTPTTIEIRFGYKPTYPLNHVYVTFSVDLESGDISTNI